jgi:2-iminobutanoate/2-iminopropanoate deaminase
MREPVTTSDAPEAIGPYSQGVRAGGLLFCSGQIPLDPSTGELVKQDAAGQARRCLENLEAVCRAAGASLAQAVRCTVYLVDMNDFARVNEVYADFFGDDPPARVAVGVAALPRGADVEIDAIVAL